MKKSILFLTSSNLSVNPRILKEMRLAEAEGYHITFIGFWLGMWTDENDRKLIKSFRNIEYRYVDATRAHFGPWFFSSVMEKMARSAWKLFSRSLFMSTVAHTKRSHLLLGALKYLNGKKFDLVIGHNLATLYPAYLASKKFGCPFAFDVEDYHPGEVIGEDALNEKKRREFLMAELLPHAVYVSGGSALITKEVQNNFKDLPNIFPIINSFESTDFDVPPNITSPKIKLVWFSQNITAGRGLELMIEAWPGVKDFCELTLIGRKDPAFVGKIIELGAGITILDPMNQDLLHKLIGSYDVGLALELSAHDLNKQLALSNKLLAYAQAGLYVLATDTPAQAEFVNQYPFIGEVVEQRAEDISSALRNIFGNLNQIRGEKKKRFEYAKQFSWDSEAKKLKQAWSTVLKEA